MPHKMQSTSHRSRVKLHAKRFQKGLSLFLTMMLCAALFSLTGCSGRSSSSDDAANTAAASIAEAGGAANENAGEHDALEASGETTGNGASAANAAMRTAAPPLSTLAVPAYSSAPAVVINGDAPYFTEGDLAQGFFEEYAPLDGLGRCGTAFALVGRETMPTEERGDIGDVKPTGWQTPISKYDFVDGKYLYNRCHLLAYQLTGENANVKNLITGTRTMNVKGMKPLEDDVAAYIERTGNHVLMRSTPYFEGENLLASGVLLEAQSIEDGGAGLRFCRWCYNVEPNVGIDYATGANWDESPATPEANTGSQSDGSEQEAVRTYILNTNSHKFHYPDCRGVKSMKDKNKQEFTGTRSEAIAMGYDPCGICLP